jgi:hypothetical protein
MVKKEKTTKAEKESALTSDMARALSAKGASKGGKARAEILTPERRKEIGRQAVTARWEKAGKIKLQDRPLKAIAGSLETPLRIGPMEIECYVLNDGTRVLSQRGVGNALSRGSGGTYLPEEDSAQKLPRFIGLKLLSGYIEPKLRAQLLEPILFATPNGSRAYGVPAEILPQICDVWIKANHDGALKTDVYKEVADRAYLLMKGFAQVGIIALVDEATGYQKQKDEYQKVLVEWIAPQLRPWLHTFDDEFYKQIYRLNGWEWDAFRNKKKQHPQVVGHFTNRIVYEKLVPGLLETLKKVNPKNESGNRKGNLHQSLSEDKGYIGLVKHLASVTTIMEQFPSGAWQEAVQKIDARYPSYKLGWQTSMDLSIESGKSKLHFNAS